MRTERQRAWELWSEGGDGPFSAWVRAALAGERLEPPSRSGHIDAVVHPIPGRPVRLPRACGGGRHVFGMRATRCRCGKTTGEINAEGRGWLR